MSWNLNLDAVKESTFEPIPPGQYVVQLAEAAIKETKSMTGEYINAKYLIVEGPSEGRSLFHMFNIKNDNPKAVEIGLSQLKSFMKCAGKTTFNLSSVSDLLGLKAIAVVKTRTDDFGEKSVISFFKPVGSPATTAAEAKAKSGKSPF